MGVVKLDRSKTKASSEDIEIMIKELRDYRDNNDLGKWQKAFYDNISASLDLGEDLTEIQILKLREIYEEHCS